MSGMIPSKGIQMRWILREYDFRSTRQMPWDDASKGAPGHPTDVSWDDYVYGSRLADYSVAPEAPVRNFEQQLSGQNSSALR